MTTATAPRPRAAARRRTSLLAHGEPRIFLTGGALALGILMVVGLLALVIVQGFSTFIPGPLVEVRTATGTWLGEVSRTEVFTPGEAVVAGASAEGRARLAAAGGRSGRRLLRTGNFELTGTHFTWISDYEVLDESRPEWAVLFERQAWGRFYGEPVAFLEDGRPVAQGAAQAYEEFLARHAAALERREARRALETEEVGRVNRRQEEARRTVRLAEMDHGPGSPEHLAADEDYRRVVAEAKVEYDALRARIAALNAENDRHALLVRTAEGEEKPIPIAEIVRAFPPNRLSVLERAGVFLSRWSEFLAGEPREANSEGGVWPAIFGTVTMTFLMCLLVVPFGILAALYLKEYARAGPLVSVIRIAINNLAGVPSIVFGVFGLGFFCYIVGSSIDGLLFRDALPNPTYGKGGLLWASFTLALLTLPVVIVATEEAIAAVPNSMREGSYACGASKWQTIRRIVLPRAMPGIMTGMILAMARGAGEVAPLMLVGAVKLAPELPIDGVAPFVHPERSFMHLGFHIYDLGFQSQNSEAAKPMVFTTTLLLIAIVVGLNVAAILLRGRLRRRFGEGHF